MPNKSTDPLFQLIKSLEKSEKRNFKLYVKKNSGDDLKIVRLFDTLDKMEYYDEALLLKKTPGLVKHQLSNMKAYLYRKILTSLRQLRDKDNLILQLSEYLEHAHILYNKGLYLQSLKILDKMKELAISTNQNTYLMQAIFFEKKIESLHITRSIQGKAQELAEKSSGLIKKLDLITRLSNLSLNLYSLYITNGHARNNEDAEAVKNYFLSQLPENLSAVKGFYEQLYLYQSYCWYSFILQDFLMYYRYSQKWVDLFEAEPQMLVLESGNYIKGMHNLLGAHFDLQNYDKFIETLKKFEDFAASDIVQQSANNRIQTFVYLSISRINKHFMEGTFKEGLKLVPDLEKELKEYELYLDRHRVLVFYYKIASLYFGSGDYETSIDYLQKIINWKVDLRTDLQCYSRLLHLIAHYELGNFELIEYLAKSVYRFMARMQNLSAVEEHIFDFLRRALRTRPSDMKKEFELLLTQLRKYERNQMETRAFNYLDIISWLESKIYGIPVHEVIRKKFLERKKRK
jgi:tetratricopeptide (TPR) repeat protein